MIYKNSMKLITSNFSLVWTQLAYTLARLHIILGLTVLVSRPIIDLLASYNFNQTLGNVWQSVYTNTSSVLSALRETIVSFCSIISQNFGKIWYSVLLFFFVTVVINAFLKHVGKYTLSYVAHNNFTSLNRCGYCHSLVSNMGKICKYALCRLVLDLPFTALKVLYVVVYCYCLNNWILAIVGISLLIILFTITYALQISICNNFAVEQIITGKNPFKSVFRSYKSQKDFAKVFSNAIVIVLTIIVINLVIGVFSFGAGLLIIIPASMVLVVIFELISHYTITQQRYYLSPTIIVDTTATGKIEKI